MGTASQLIDELVRETSRYDLLNEITSYVAQTVRELHSEPVRNNNVLYPNNLREVQLAAAQNPVSLTWEIPDPALFQKIQTVEYASIYNPGGSRTFAEYRVPGPAMNRNGAYYYRAGSTFVFSGYGGINGIVKLAYYEYPKRLPYFAAAVRPASYDWDEGWTYLTAVTDEEKEIARFKVTNWLILRWYDTVKEGVRAKIYKRLSDDGRARTAYSLYSGMRQNLYTAEGFDSGGG